MIVVDTNVLISLFLPSQNAAVVENLLATDAEWAAPLLWRSEFRNVLATYWRKGLLSFDQIYATQTEAEQLLKSNEFEMDSFDVLDVATSSGLSSYDSEFVSLAKHLRTSLATFDRKVLNEFAHVACTPASLIN